MVDHLDIPDCGCKLVVLKCACKKRAEEFRVLAKAMRRDKIAALVADDQTAAADIEDDVHAALAAAKQLDHCDCLILGPPCEHILKYWQTWPKRCTYDDYVELVRSLNIDIFKRDQEWRVNHDYHEPPPAAPVRLTAFEHATRVALYTSRHNFGQRLYNRSTDLIDPSTIAEDGGTVGELGLQGGDRFANGEDRKDLGLGTGTDD